MMSIRAEVGRLEQLRAAKEDALAIAVKEQTGKQGNLRAEIDSLGARIDDLRPLMEPEPLPAGQMVPCPVCQRPVWPESVGCDEHRAELTED